MTTMKTSGSELGTMPLETVFTVFRCFTEVFYCLNILEKNGTILYQCL